MNIFREKVLFLTILGLVALILPAVLIVNTNPKVDKEKSIYKVSDEVINTVTIGN